MSSSPLAGKTGFRPDACVLLGERANFEPRKIPTHGAPDIAVEVISPTERTGDTRRKVLAYLKFGVREIWQIYPVTREVLVYAGAGGANFRITRALQRNCCPAGACQLRRCSNKTLSSPAR